MKHISKILLITVISLLFNQSMKAQWVKTNFPNGLDIEAMVVSRNNIFAGTDGGIYLSSDNGTTWNAVNNGIIGRRVVSLAASGENIYAGTSEIGDGPHGLLFLSTNAGANWKALYNGLYSSAISAIAANGNYVFVAAASQQISGAYYGIFASIDTGASWYEVDSGLTDRDVNSLVINENNIFAGTRSGVFLSTNNAANWEKVNHGMNDSVITSLFTNGNNIYAGTYNGEFLLSTNSGQIWRTLGSSLIDIQSILVINNGNDIIVGTWGNGLYLLTASDTNWKAINDGLASTYSPYVSSIVVKDDELYIGTQDGVWKRPLTEVITSIDNIKNNKPDKYELNQNYPNPFNPSTVISYTLPSESTVLIKFFNSLGQIVREVDEGTKQAGKYELNFNSSGLASGIYFYSIKAVSVDGKNNFSTIKKMILMK